MLLHRKVQNNTLSTILMLQLLEFKAIKVPKTSPDTNWIFVMIKQ